MVNKSRTHQADEDEDKLYDVCVGHRVEASHQGVGDGYRSRNPDAHGVRQVQDHTHGYTCGIFTHLHVSGVSANLQLTQARGFHTHASGQCYL